MKPPKYRRHSSRDIGFAERNGKRLYFPGKYGSEQSRAAYERFIRGENVIVVEPHSAVSVHTLAMLFLDWAQRYFGEGRTRYGVYRTAMRPLLEKFGPEIATDFGPRKLKQLQEHLASQGLKRSYVNYTINAVRYCFKWAASEELVPASNYEALMTVQGLRVGHSTAAESPHRRPVAWESVVAILPYLSPNVRAMVQFHWFTAFRSKSICKAKPEQFTKLSASSWEWRPRHKTEGIVENLVIPIGPRAQAIIGPFVNATPPGEYLFRPADKSGRARYRRRYTSDTYRKAIVKAIHRVNLDRARECPEQSQVALWSPHQLRHTQAQRIRELYGIEGAQAILGHESINATQIYSTRRLELARTIALEIG